MRHALAITRIPGIPYLMTRFGEAIRERREWVGFETATACAQASEQLELDNARSFKAFSQSSLSRWELDRTGAAIESAHAKSLRSLAYLLKWASDEFEAHVGVPIGRGPHFDDPLEVEDFQLPGRQVRLVGGLVMVPVVGVANGGKPAEYGIPVRPDLVRGDNTRSYQVEGDSMAIGERDGIRDGEWVLVDRSLTKPANGKVFLLEILGDGMTVKRLRQVAGEWFFLSDNPEVGESWRHDQVRIIGQVYGKVDFAEIH